ncbi:MAG TPA: YARHG domain-containing protein [Thermoanaerobaculia bacterium]|nr:YARHG domain-containing protein [Thermoanaerobaculia bacterium]
MLSTILSAMAALASALTSVFAIALAYYTFQHTLRAAVRPVLVFTLTPDLIWQVQNVGTGPAITVTIGDKWLGQDWGTVVTCHAMAPQAVKLLPWIHEGAEIAAVYSDIFNQFHTTRCVKGRNETLRGNRFGNWTPKRTEWELEVVRDPELLLYTEKDLRGKTPFQLDVMRNEFYARKGYRFRRADLAEYFSQLPWYKPTTSDQVEVNRKLSHEERQTALFILYFQDRNNLRSK